MNDKEKIKHQLEILSKFSNNIFSHDINRSDHLDAVSKLELLEKRLQNNEYQVSNDDLTNFLYPTRDMMICLKPRIKNQLRIFWNSFTHINAEINKRKIHTEISMFDYDRVDDMGTLNAIHVDVLEKFLQKPNEESHILALFYCHVVRVDIFEKIIKPSYENLLKEYGLDDKFDSNQIFSIIEPAKMKTKKGVIDITDIKAIRNCLSHKLYAIIQNNEWRIEFNSTHGKTIYNKSFTKIEFVDFLNDSNLLYQIMIMLMHVFSLITHLSKLTTNKLSLLPYRD